MTTYTSVEDVARGMGLTEATKVITGDSGAGAVGGDDMVYVGDYTAHYPLGAKVRVARRNASGDIITVFEDRTIILVDTLNGRIQVDVDLAHDYTTGQNAVCQILGHFTTVTPTRYQDVVRMIEEIEDQIDMFTHQSWRQRVYTEWHDFYAANRRTHYPQTWGVRYSSPADTFWNVDLLRRDMFSLTYNPALLPYEGYLSDSLRVWNGTVWEEWIDQDAPEYVVKVNDRQQGDYWIDEQNGILFFMDSRPHFDRNAIYIRYRAGKALFREDPSGLAPVRTSGAAYQDIQRACRLKVTAELIGQERYAVEFAGGDESGAITPNLAARNMNQEAERILARHVVTMAWTGER